MPVQEQSFRHWALTQGQEKKNGFVDILVVTSQAHASFHQPDTIALYPIPQNRDRIELAIRC